MTLQEIIEERKRLTKLVNDLERQITALQEKMLDEIGYIDIRIGNTVCRMYKKEDVDER